ncbi:3-keto-5-aminohexanoate cleavage protein [Paracidovorax anthurii]|uniref:Uncharacterized protein (DUF849 family) n=1 Tax=Paracidovorax anthurii TaxID=78229 RepID=A0A328YXX5_9BURK|nr:3-keto-5-aminohexanoate cleavage protein [Paracidovorax anthurii]RAR77062.1 uncharacterized protein (DUF849 family) [Paracidovorax anthurii]
MQDIFITAAPVGAVPRNIDPQGPKYFPAALVQEIPYLQAALENDKGWETVEKGGLVASESTRIAADSEFIRNIAPTVAQISDLLQETGLLEKSGILQYQAPDNPAIRRLDAEWFRRIPRKKIASELVLHLTSQGWVGDGAGGLAWKHAGFVESCIPPRLVDLLRLGAPGAVDGLIAAGWRLAGPGYALSSKGASPWLPITPEAIVEESVAAAREGAAILHLHTRERADECAWNLPWSPLPVALGSQANRIVPADYDGIVPRLRAEAPLALLNLSTSVRGGGDSESAIRREHLKAYGPDGMAPDMSSLSPGEVLFQAGGGYRNTPAFLEQQLAHGRTHAVRPEVEVFNRTILRETLGPFKARLAEAGTPCLLMLVAGVDQHRRAGDTLEDDSLIPAAQRQEIFSLLQAGEPADIDRALDMTVAALAPIVEEIRRHLPGAKVSTLMPGPMQQLLARVAVRLRLDGVRVGLEDGLTVFDRTVPGGIRKGRTAEQVRQIREELEALGCHVLSAEDTRRVLRMPAATESLFLAAMDATAHLAFTGDLAPGHAMATLAGALRPLRPAFERREQWLRERLARQARGDTGNAARAVRDLVRQAGLYVRYFVEERDRYPAEGAGAFRNLYEIQSLNYAWELLQEAGQDASFYENALQDLARACDIGPQGFLTLPHQRKSADLRFLEYLVSLSCGFSPDRRDVQNLGLRLRPGYNAFLATLFKAVEEEYRRLRAASQAEPKSAGLLAFQVGTGDGAADTLAPQELRRHLRQSHWIVLPSTPTTHYAEGIKLSRGLGATFLSHLQRLLPRHAPSLRLVGFVHSGRDENGAPLIEASMLNNRFLLGTERHASIVGHSSRLLYEAILLPQLVEQPERLLRTPGGTVAREAGVPLYEDRSPARRIDFRAIEDLPPLRFLAHSSGIATMQQMDNAMRQDLELLGYSHLEQTELFNRNVVVSFASAADIHPDVSGTPTVDVTAYNDIRSMAGTTTPDYLIHDAHRRRQARAASDENHRYDATEWKLIRGAAGKTVLRRTGVFLREDPVRQHDGHSIRRYLEGAPEAVAVLLGQLHSMSGAPRFDFTLRRLASTQAPVAEEQQA